MKHNVSHFELPENPTIEIKNDKIYIFVKNSIVNSAKAIYRIHYEIKKNQLRLSAEQRLTNLPFLKYENEIVVELKGKTINDFYWINPDSTKVKLL